MPPWRRRRARWRAASPGRGGVRGAARGARRARAGVGPEDRVGLLMGRSAHLVTAELGIALSGGAYVPLDVRAPAERMRAVLAESGAAVLVTDGAWEGVAREVHRGPLLVMGG